MTFPLAFLVCCDNAGCWTRPFDGKSSGEIDAAIVTTYMMLEAADLRLGSIWVMYWDPAAMKAEFSLPDTVEPVALLIVGYKAEGTRPRGGQLSTKSAAEIML